VAPNSELLSLRTGGFIAGEAFQKNALACRRAGRSCGKVADSIRARPTIKAKRIYQTD